MNSHCSHIGRHTKLWDESNKEQFLYNIDLSALDSVQDNNLRLQNNINIIQNDIDSLNLNLNSSLVKRQIDNPSPGAVTGGN